MFYYASQGEAEQKFPKTEGRAHDDSFCGCSEGDPGMGVGIAIAASAIGKEGLHAANNSSQLQGSPRVGGDWVLESKIGICV
jgi:hypothetical protein